MSIHVSKIAAGQRQLDAAIRLLFVGEDRLPIYTIAAAALGILRDIGDSRGVGFKSSIGAAMHQLHPSFRFSDKQIADISGQMRRLKNKPANFLKHADYDPGGFLAEPTTSELDDVIAEASLIYRNLYLSPTPEMDAFAHWYCAVYPRGDEDIRQTQLGPLHLIDREFQLELGAHVLSVIRERRSVE